MQKSIFDEGVKNSQKADYFEPRDSDDDDSLELYLDQNLQLKSSIVQSKKDASSDGLEEDVAYGKDWFKPGLLSSPEAKLQKPTYG